VVSSVVRLAAPATGDPELAVARLLNDTSADSVAFRAAVAALLSREASDVAVTSAVVETNTASNATEGGHASVVLVVSFEVTVSSSAASDGDGGDGGGGGSGSSSQRRMLQQGSGGGESSAAAMADETAALLARAMDESEGGDDGGGSSSASLASYLAAAAAENNVVGMATSLDEGPQLPPVSVASTPPYDPVAALEAEVWSQLQQVSVLNTPYDRTFLRRNFESSLENHSGIHRGE